MIKKERMLGHTGLVKLDKNYLKTNIAGDSRRSTWVPCRTSPFTRTGRGRTADAGADGTEPAPTTGAHDADAPDARHSAGKNASGTPLTSGSPCPNCKRACGVHTAEGFKRCLVQLATKTMSNQPGT